MSVKKSRGTVHPAVTAAPDGRAYRRRKILFIGDRITLVRDWIDWKGGVLRKDWVRRPGVSAIVAVPSPGRILLVSQYRYGIHRRLWEIPAGTLHSGEDPKLCAIRECEEETGFKPLRMKALGFFVPSPASVDETVYLYLADRMLKTRQNLDHEEEIEVKVFAAAAVKRMLLRNEIQDAKSIIGLHRYFFKTHRRER